MSHGSALIIFKLHLSIHWIQLLLMWEGGGYFNLKHVLRHSLRAILGQKPIRMICLLLDRHLVRYPHHPFLIITSVPERELLGTILLVHMLLAFKVTSEHLPLHHLRLHNLRYQLWRHHHVLVLRHNRMLGSMMVRASAGDLLACRHSLSQRALHSCHSLMQWRGILLREELWLIHWPEIVARRETMELGRKLLGDSKL